MNRTKATHQEIYEVIDQQKKLQELRAKIVGVLEKVNQSINMIAVENLELTYSQVETLETKNESVDQKAIVYHDPSEHEKRAEEINQQIIDLELNMAQYEEESDESELET